MAELTVRFDLSFGARTMRCLMASAMILSAVTEVASESVTLTTYYPAPSGVYSQMITTGNTYLARDGGSVGIGTTTPGSKLEINGDLRFSGANPTIYTAGSYFQVPNGAYFYGGTVYFQTQSQFRAGIHNDSAPSLAINGGTSGLTSFTGYAIDCFNTYCPPNYMMRLTPNLHLNANLQYAVIVNWDNGAAPVGTWEFRVGNGAGADQFYVTNTGESVSQYKVATDGACSEVVYAVDGTTNCPGGQYATFTSGIISYYAEGPLYSAGITGATAPMLCCNCPASGCPL